VPRHPSAIAGCPKSAQKVPKNTRMLLMLPPDATGHSKPRNCRILPPLGTHPMVVPNS
jgi:hypothetical protein